MKEELKVGDFIFVMEIGGAAPGIIKEMCQDESVMIEFSYSGRIQKVHKRFVISEDKWKKISENLRGKDENIGNWMKINEV